MPKRSPVIVVMGHVDHGKTTLLDYVRKSSVAAREAGGITQSIGAYEIEVHPSDEPKSRESEARRGIPRQTPRDDFANTRKITFIDTPGHEAFIKMRARGAKIADIAILVVAADDGVKPQTKESINIIREAKLPFIVAINKIDKPNADLNRTKNDLMQAGVLLEGYGGNVSFQEISAKTGQGVNELLDLILLTAEVENLTYDPAAPGRGFILESKLDSRRGITVVAIVKDGILKTGDEIAAGPAGGKIKTLENFLGQPIKEAVPSSPVLILGFESLPAVGEEFTAGAGAAAAKSEIKAAKKIAGATAENKHTINLVLKADVAGSLEALVEIVRNLPAPENTVIYIINQSVGEITDGDVKTAISTKAAIIGFRTKANKAAENLAKSQNVKIILSDIIYELVKAVEAAMKELQAGTIKGDLEILAVFGKKGGQQIVGGRVVAGEIRNNTVVAIQRKKDIIGQAKIINLQQQKKDAPKVETGKEAGLLVDATKDIQVGDHLLLK